MSDCLIGCIVSDDEGRGYYCDECPGMRKRDTSGIVDPDGFTRPRDCSDCGHIHTPTGCMGSPTPSDLWAGVNPSDCDCAGTESYRDAFFRVFERCNELNTEVAEHQHNALEMARKADAAERRAEEAEYHVEQLRDALGRAERRLERVEALADGWAKDYPSSAAACSREINEWWIDLRAALEGIGGAGTGDSAERIGERAAELATERDAALARIARTERLIDSWEHDAPEHSNPVFIGRLRECLRRAPAPVRLRGDER